MGVMLVRGLARIPVTLVLALASRKHVRRVDPYRHELCDQHDSIFKTTGDMAVPYCLAYEGAVGSSYDDGSSLYPEAGDIVVTLVDGRRFII